MADSAVPITGGSGYNVDTRTESTNGNHRQVISIGDPSSNGGVAPVDATNGVSVTLTTPLVAGTAAIGKLAANDGVDVGDVTINNAVGAGVYIRPGTGVNLDTTNVTVATSALPSGAATAAHQVTQNTSLSDITTAVQLIDDAVYTDGTGTPSKALAVAGTDGTNPQIVSVTSAGAVNIADGGNTITVDGTVAATQSGTWNVTNVSGTVSLPTGASTSAKQDTIITSVQLIDDAIYADATGTPDKGIAIMGTDGTNPQLVSVTSAGLLNIADGGGNISIDDGGNTITVDGTITANLGTIGGASTAAKQPALGTAGTASTDVITVQGIASMTALTVDGSGVTQPVSGTITANAGTGFPALITDGSAAGTVGIHILGTDGTNGQIISTNSSGHINIADGGNTITVDGTVAATQSGTWTVQPGNTANTTPWLASIHDGTTKASVLDLTNNNPLTVAIVDTSGDQIASFGGGTQYTEDAAAAANPVGTAMMLVREDGRAGSLTTTDGDNVAARGNNKGELYVKTTDSDALLTTIDADTGNISTKIDTIAGAVSGTEMQVDVLTMPTVTVNAHAVTNAGTFVVQENGAALTALQLIDDTVFTDDAAFTPATSKVIMVGAEFDNVTPDSIDEGDAGALRMSANRNLFVNIRDNAGNERGLNIDASGQLAVTLAASQTLATVTTVGTVTNITNQGHLADDAAFTPGTTRVMMAGFEFDDTTPDSVNEGDGGAARMSANRNIYTTLRDAAGNERGANINASNQLSVSVDNTVTVASHAVTNAGTFATQAAQSGTYSVRPDSYATDDTAMPTTPLVVPVAGEYRNAATTYTDGDATVLQSDVNGYLKVNVAAGGTSGTQYTEGDTDATITGTAILWENTADTLATVNETTPLPTKLYVSGGLLEGTNPNDDTQAVSGLSLRTIGLNYAYNGTDWVRIRGDVSNGMDVDVTRLPALVANSGVDIGDVTINNLTSTPVYTQHNLTGLGHGVTTVTTAGTDVALAGSTACKKVIIQAQTDNTTGIAVGATGVDATVATGTGIFLYPGDSIELEIDNLADIFIDSLTNGEGVRYTYFT